MQRQTTKLTFEQSLNLLHALEIALCEYRDRAEQCRKAELGDAVKHWDQRIAQAEELAHLFLPADEILTCVLIPEVE